MNKHHIRLSLLCMFLLPSFVSAGTYADFPLAQVSELKPFARDLGGLIGSGTNQTARILGFSGFDIGVRTAVQFKPEKSDLILKQDHPFSLTWMQAEIGMPYRIDGFVRAGAYDGISLAGGGLKYGLFKPMDEPYRLQTMIVAMANMASSRYFYAVHFGSSLICSINVPYVAPYFGAGFDNTKLAVQATVVNSELNGKRVYAMEPRYTFGLRAKLKLAYLSGGVTYTHGQTLVNAGAGLRF